MDEKHVLAVGAKWFNNIPIYDKKILPIDYKFLKVEPKELDQFENNQFTTNFSQEIQKYDENDNVSQEYFFDYLLEVDNKSNIGLTNKLSPYLMLNDAFKEITSNLEGHCTIEEINDIRFYFTNKVIKYKKSTKYVERNSQSG